MGVIRRVVVPVVLCVIMVGAAIGAYRLDQDTASAPGTAEGESSSVTPILSARRVPVFVTTPGADLVLRLRLIELVGTAPADSCVVVEVDGREILAHQADRSLVPASTEKLPLAAAVLDELGPDHRFSTEFRAGPVSADGTIEGDAWLVGGGDPQLSTDPYAATQEAQEAARSSLEDLADAIAAAGVRRVTGRLLADETRYDAVRYVPGWPPRFADQNQTGPLSALSVNDGFSSFATQQAPESPLEPANDPRALAAVSLALLLSERGVAIDGGIASGAAPAEATAVAALDSAPLGDIVGQMLTYSDNQTAEMLLKEMGVQVGGGGSSAAGAEAVGSSLGASGFDLSGTVFADGSGLAADNRTTCLLLSELLTAAGTDSALAAGLAVAGETGTLAEAFADTRAAGRLIAKTGSLNEVRSLAGFVDNRLADDVVFALVLNRAPFIDPADVVLRDAIAETLATYPERPPLDEVGPRPIDP